jgi:hypothetical protein
VSLRSETGEPDCAAIDAGESGRILTCTDLDSTTVIEGLTLRNGSAAGPWPANAGGAILCRNAAPRIRRCVFRTNSAAYGGAVACWTAAPRIEQSTFFENRSTETGAGLYAYYGSAVALDGCLIAGSTAGAAVTCWYSSSVDVRCSDVWGNAGGDWTGCLSGRNGVDGNVSADPAFCTPFDGHVASFSPCLPENSAPECGLIGALGAGCDYTDVRDGAAPMAFFLGPAVPNPFNPVTEIAFGIPSSATTHRVTLQVYDVLGRRVKTLVDADRTPGLYRAVWDGTDHHHAPAASGVYFYRLTWNGKSETRRMVLLQ